MDCTLLLETPDCLVLDLDGALDAKGAAAIEKTLLDHAAKATRHVVLDIADVTFMASIGLRLVLQTAKTLARKDLQLVLAAPAPMVNKVIHDAALDKLMPVVPDLDAARGLLQAS